MFVENGKKVNVNLNLSQSIYMKKKIEDLAIFGGTPLFSNKITVNLPNIVDENDFFDRVKKTFKEKILTNDGPSVKELELEISSYLNVKHCILTCNGTIALQLVSKALDLRNEIIVPSFTFIATPHSMLWQGLVPVFCDVNEYTHNIDFKACEKLITDKTTAILGVHLWGRPCEIDELEKLATKYNIVLFFDSAHAFGSSYKHKMIGNFGRAEVFSFHATKFFHTFEGGAITTNDDMLASKIRNLRNFGFIEYDCVDGLGINAKMSEISAAMGLSNFKYIESLIENNRRKYLKYLQCLRKIKGLKMVEYDHDEKNNYQYIVVENDEEITGINRDSILKILHKENIFARRYFYPGCHKMEPYVNEFISDKSLHQNTDKLSRKLFVLPSGSDITFDTIEKISDVLDFISANSTKLKDTYVIF